MSSSFSFCYCFYDGFIPRIILISRFLPFTCISYLLKFFRFDTGILRDACALNKNFERTTTDCSFFMADFVSHVCLQHLLFHKFVTMIYWTSTEVLLNLAAPIDSAVLSLALSKLIFFEVPLSISLVSAQCQVSVSRRLPELYFWHSI